MLKETVLAATTLAISIVTSVGSTSFIVGSNSAKMEARIDSNAKDIKANKERIDEWENTTKIFINTLNDIKVDVAVTKENVLWLKGERNAKHDET